MVTLRRQLHTHPELSGEEVETTRRLCELLEGHGVRVRSLQDGRGLVADSADQTAPRRVALRGDIDALPIQDQKQVEYRSRAEGVMHACGHDAHAACVYGAALALDTAAAAGELPWPVSWRALFQPAEETATGAKQMIAEGELAAVASILSLHVDPSRPAGVIGVRAETFTAHCDDLRIKIEGVGGHAARPHECRDPIAASALLINSLYQIVPRSIDSQDSCVLAITKMRGGHTTNVIPSHVELAGMVRSLGGDVRSQALAQVAHLADGIAGLTGTKIHVEFGAHLPGVENDPRLTDLVASVARSLLGADRVEQIGRPSMGGEDFAYYLDHVPGMMFRLGAARSAAPAFGLHTPLFDIDERCLPIGAKILAAAVVEESKPDAARRP
ncbi:amidohydrolase [Botrimarina sp.]|uniref:M20 metallopeptidase family protein n=1 Tax=Botrimarina sp. TaxID=2795802 RepID=UPI0032EF4C9B